MLRAPAIALLIATFVTIFGCGGGSPSTAPTSPSSPANISISPTTAVTGSPDVTLTISGSNFLGETHNFSQAVWSANSNNTLLATTFVSSTQLTAVVPSAFLTNPITAQVFVQTGDPMGDLPPSKSNPIDFRVTTPPPSIAISPTSAVAGSPDLTLTITATGFAFTTDPHKFNRAVWSASGRTSLVTTFVSSTEVSAVVTAALLSNPVTAQVFVEVWDSMGDVPDRTSPSASFSVTSTTAHKSSGFASASDMSKPRSGHTATQLMNGKVLIAGGSDETAELFDPASESFASTGSMSTSRYGATATLLANGKVLVVGGFGPGTSELPRLATAELYDPLRGTFSETGTLAFPRVQHTATLLNDGRVLITGGTINHVGGGTASASAELYDPSTGLFSTVGSMMSDRAQHTATLLGNGQVLIAGGWNGHAFDFPDDPPFDPLFAELFDPSSGGFTKTGSMRTMRMNHSATGLLGRMVLVTGGWTGGSGTSASAELYDLSSLTFSSAGNLALSRQHHTATLLSNGDVLIVGGENAITFPGRAVGSAELFDPVAGNFTATGGLVTARKTHTATLLLDGRVLVTGGVDSNGNTLASAEVYK
jgi:Galactose oxidase, central domain